MPRAKKQAPVKMGVNTGHNAPAVPTGMPYGAHQAAQQSIAAAPVAGPSGATDPLAPPNPGAGAAGAPPDPAQALAAVQQYAPQTGNLLADTGRPGEPVTAGLSSGPGPGPETMPGGPDIVGAQLRALYQLSPSPDILRLIELHDRGL